MIAAEVLGIAVRQEKEIEGIQIGKKETKLLQYADDTTAVPSDINSARALFKLLADSQKLSGLRVNPTKRKECGLAPQDKVTPNHSVSNGQMNQSKRSVYTILTIQNCFIKKILLKS